MQTATEATAHQQARPPPTGTTRRQLLRTALAVGATWAGASPDSALGAYPAAGRATRAAKLRVLAAWQHQGTAYAGVWSPGQPPRGVALPARAHELLPLRTEAGLPGRQALIVARRPGEYMLRMDLTTARPLQWHTMEEDRYLAGHACASHDGSRFFTTETEGETGGGRVVERDWHSLEKLREFTSHGIGPHAICSDRSAALWVANGGILNLPETGRRKLNLGRMASNLCRLHAASGEVLDQHTLDDPFLSLRHIALSPDGTLAVALQAEHPDRKARAQSPALALLRDGKLQPVPWDGNRPPSGWDGYAGDVCYHGGRFWISAPHAGWLVSWSVHGESQRMVRLPGAAALGAQGTRMLAGGESATLLLPTEGRAAVRHPLPTPWDNHAALLSAPGPGA